MIFGRRNNFLTKFQAFFFLYYYIRKVINLHKNPQSNNK